MLPTICPDCGSPHDQRAARCEECQPPAPKRTPEQEQQRGSSHQRGYDRVWRNLSERARRLQSFCSDCGRPDQLTLDHSTEAWRRHELGLPIRLRDVAVVCVQCNIDRGAARGPDASDDRRRDAWTELADVIDTLDTQGG